MRFGVQYCYVHGLPLLFQTNSPARKGDSIIGPMLFSDTRTKSAMFNRLSTLPVPLFAAILSTAVNRPSSPGVSIPVAPVPRGIHFVDIDEHDVMTPRTVVVGGSNPYGLLCYVNW